MGQVFLISPIKRQRVDGFSFRLVCWMWLIKLQTHDRCMIQMILLIVMANSMSYQNGVDRLMPVKCFIKSIQMKQTVAVDHVSFNYGFKWKIQIRITCLKKMRKVLAPAKLPAIWCQGVLGVSQGVCMLKNPCAKSCLSSLLQCKSKGFFTRFNICQDCRLYKKVQLQRSKSMKYLKNHSWLQHILNV